MVRPTRLFAIAMALGLGVSTLGGCGTPPHAANAFTGARPYVNPEYKARVLASSFARSNATKAQVVANAGAAGWLDRIAAIDPPGTAMGLREHLDAALTQASSGTGQVAITFVIYDLPGRDCAALASNGELGPTEIGRYRAEYIDPIAAVMAEAKYANLRIVTIIEPDSLPNLVTNTSGANTKATCQTVQQNGAYVQGVQYALNKLHAIGNVYTYVDIAHSGWLGWDSNLGPAAELIATTVKGTTAGVASVDGFISNTANYTPLDEPNIPFGKQINGQDVRQASFYEWNPYFDERDYVDAMKQQFVSRGFPQSIGMLVDTSRNGWPTKAASTSTDINTFVTGSKLDQRRHRGNWCNQTRVGIGQRPQAIGNGTTDLLDAYVWIKPPGESDGSSSLIPNNDGKGFDQMCDPNYGGNGLNGNGATEALGSAPISGQWFDAHFSQLATNANPQL
jgi:cellulose 1,4-beta-cellobiosidase